MKLYLKHAVLGFLISLLIFTCLLFIMIILSINNNHYYNNHYSESLIKTDETGLLFVNSVYYGKIYFAITPKQQTQGLMNISNLSNGFIGMLFIFNTTKKQCFWMKNTILPLHQYWLVNGTIIYTWNGIPYSTNVICNNGDAVLETPNLILRDGQKISFNISNLS